MRPLDAGRIVLHLQPLCHARPCKAGLGCSIPGRGIAKMGKTRLALHKYEGHALQRIRLLPRPVNACLAALIWIGGMVLFGIGALLAHTDFDGERPNKEEFGDVRVTR